MAWNPRTASIGIEAGESVEEWLKNRRRSLKLPLRVAGRNTGDTCTWPFEDNTAYSIWRNDVYESGFDKRFQYNNGLGSLLTPCSDKVFGGTYGFSHPG